MNDFGLTIAVPRGALFERDARPARRRSAIDTAEVRANDRKLLFEDVGIVTMRPSDVPTYVEAGAADIGITGKDVLHGAARAPGLRAARPRLRRRARWCSPRATGADAADEALRRLGVVRVATKYPRIAAEYLESTGRQAEIVEVKGSVELAPLTGMVEAIVDLTATGTTLRENGLVVREEIATSTARLIANRVALRSRPRRSTRSWSACVADCAGSRSTSAGEAPALAAELRARACPAARTSAQRSREIVAEVRAGGDAALRALAPSTTGSTPATPLRVAPDELDAALGALDADGCARRSSSRSRTSPRSRAPASATTPTSRCPQGQSVRAARAPGRPRRDLRPRRPRAVPEQRRDGRRHRARGGRATRSSSARPAGTR